MDISKLRIFATVAKLGNFTRAAELLYLTQPTVSQQIAALEAQLGTPLIERLPRRLKLTAAGDALLPYAEQILALADAASEAARAAAGLADHTLRLGAGHTLATYLLPDLLGNYRTRHPGRVVRISVGNTTELLELVAADAVELALVGSPASHPKLTVTPFMHDRLVVIVAPDDPWAAREQVALAELRGRVLLTREPGSALHASVERLLGAATLSSDSVILLGETEAIKRSVEAGLGVALVQEIAVERELAAGNLRALALHGADDTRTYNYAHRAGRALSAAADGLVALLTSRAPG
ncbi:MAG: LysR family transcriptional regulator [Kouleothrix sp.]|jgi:DNA-binding transcriptional LysR family regulator